MDGILIATKAVYKQFWALVHIEDNKIYLRNRLGECLKYEEIEADVEGDVPGEIIVQNATVHVPDAPVPVSHLTLFASPGEFVHCCAIDKNSFGLGFQRTLGGPLIASIVHICP